MGRALYQGDLDMNRVLRELVEIGHGGKMGYIKRRFEPAQAWNLQPSDYLGKSISG